MLYTEKRNSRRRRRNNGRRLEDKMATHDSYGLAVLCVMVTVIIIAGFLVALASPSL